jgi:hypothetical protein
MPSFDIVSEIDAQEVRNAVENSRRELEGRFDFRGVQAGFEWSAKETVLTAEAEFQLQQMLEILRKNLVKRKVDINVLEAGEPVHSGKSFNMKVTFKQGIDQPTAKKLVQLLKDSKLKVQASIQGEQVRVTGKKRDDLQEAIALVRGAELKLPFQFTNFRE